MYYKSIFSDDKFNMGPIVVCPGSGYSFINSLLTDEAIFSILTNPSSSIGDRSKRGIKRQRIQNQRHHQRQRRSVEDIITDTFGPEYSLDNYRDIVHFLKRVMAGALNGHTIELTFHSDDGAAFYIQNEGK